MFIRENSEVFVHGCMQNSRLKVQKSMPVCVCVSVFVLHNTDVSEGVCVCVSVLKFVHVNDFP